MKWANRFGSDNKSFEWTLYSNHCMWGSAVENEAGDLIPATCRWFNAVPFIGAYCTQLIPSRNYFNTKLHIYLHTSTATARPNKCGREAGVIILNKCNQLVKYFMTISRFHIKLALKRVWMGWKCFYWFCRDFEDATFGLILAQHSFIFRSIHLGRYTKTCKIMEMRTKLETLSTGKILCSVKAE